MKPSISKATLSYLKSLSTKSDEPDFHAENLDAIDQLIYEHGLRIRQLYFDKELDLMLIVLNNRKVIKRSISDFKQLGEATEKQLNHFENDGTGVHWPDVDEDLSLRGFLQYELTQIDRPLVA